MSRSKIFFRFLTGVAAFMLLSAQLFGQAQINTRKEKLKDFTSCITKVVLSGNDLQDEALRESVSSRWSLSPYEFCTAEEFNSLKTDSDYYFLLVTQMKEGKEEVPGIKMLTLVKGDPDAEKGIGDMLEVVSFPLCSATSPSGREMVMMPAFIDIIQEHTERQFSGNEMKAFSGLNVYNRNASKLWNKRLYISSEDLGVQVDDKLLSSLDEDVVIEDADAVDEIFANQTYNAAVTYVVAPSDPVKGSVCYKMIFDAYDHELYYFRKHKITENSGAGFLAKDIKDIKSSRKEK